MYIMAGVYIRASPTLLLGKFETRYFINTQSHFHSRVTRSDYRIEPRIESNSPYDKISCPGLTSIFFYNTGCIVVSAPSSLRGYAKLEGRVPRLVAWTKIAQPIRV